MAHDFPPSKTRAPAVCNFCFDWPLIRVSETGYTAGGNSSDLPVVAIKALREVLGNPNRCQEESLKDHQSAPWVVVAH